MWKEWFLNCCRCFYLDWYMTLNWNVAGKLHVLGHLLVCKWEYGWDFVHSYIMCVRVCVCTCMCAHAFFLPWYLPLCVRFTLFIHLLSSLFCTQRVNRCLFRKNITGLPFLQHLSISTGAWYCADSHWQQYRLTTWPHQFPLSATSAYTFGPGGSKQFPLQHGECSPIINLVLFYNKTQAYYLSFLSCVLLFG